MPPVCEYCGGFGIDHVWGCLITTDVAESKNTDHEGGSEVNEFTNIKGTLRHKDTGKTIEGVELVFKGPVSFDVALVPGESANTFRSREWEFVPDKKPLPHHAIISAPGYLPLVITQGKVHQAIHGSESGKRELVEKDEEFALHRLRMRGAVLIANQEILDKEEYL